jgi:hypothetical protein
MIAVGVGWARFARHIVPAWVFLAAPFYFAWKVPLYALLLLKGRQRTWERTQRPGEERDGLPPQVPGPG